jgi:8-oxo-dGTP pyrophosphatase MutT (NUDIX family)
MGVMAGARFDLARIDLALRKREHRIIEGAARAAAVALVLREGQRDLEALFIKRADHKDDPWSGHIGLPGGRAESHDPGLVHTAIRETAEEIGLILAEENNLIGALDETRATARRVSVDLKIAPFVFLARNAPDVLTLSDEVAATHWIELGELFDSGSVTRVTLEHDKQKLHFPAIEVRGVTIWGLTLRMLRNFESLVAQP